MDSLTTEGVEYYKEQTGRKPVLLIGFKPQDGNWNPLKLLWDMSQEDCMPME